MVCQAASQTNFRALKHENGIAGSATIIVRVIACFHPLQDCQAEYFRHLLKPVTIGDCYSWMGEDWGSWFHQQQFDWQSPNLNYLGAPYNLGQQYTAPSFMNSGTDMVSIKGTLPAFMPALNSGLKEKLVTVPCDDHKEAIAPKVEPGCQQKKFLVFDQSGKNDTELQSDMHEDTEELNALLYSDDDSDSTDDDEVTSTGHSPSTMTAHNNQDWFEGSIEEVASSDGSTKKRKLFEGGYSVLPALMDTASSMKPIRSCEFEDDAESRCEDGLDWTSGEMNSEPTKKRIRKERIRETVSILQNIIPGGKGKDATVVLDEAINYLKSLKLKAKALGLDAS
ncbi:hypothetical protein GH714_026143 [Hevea brasiliensis]|uniref:BHLH domain-containing protein n=2 Tax=Crotonoideae TaxID=235631 RepID=A0A6A6KRI0_HEVBR|nr:hypothetical protein GH714_026143 [Hevea brasiliensis]